VNSSFDPPALDTNDSAAPAGDSSARKTYTNPILDCDFPDPAVIKAGDGYYYAYATQSLREGRWVNIQVARSPDLIHWEHLGEALPEKPAWAQHTQDFWAPYVLYDGARYLMYYSATHDACHDPQRGHFEPLVTRGIFPLMSISAGTVCVQMGQCARPCVWRSNMFIIFLSPPYLLRRIIRSTGLERLRKTS